MFIVAPNFAVDCLETLYDIEVELKQRLLAEDPSLSEDDIVYVPCLNDSDAHVATLCELIENHLRFQPE